MHLKNIFKDNELDENSVTEQSINTTEELTVTMLDENSVTEQS